MTDALRELCEWLEEFNTDVIRPHSCGNLVADIFSQSQSAIEALVAENEQYSNEIGSLALHVSTLQDENAKLKDKLASLARRLGDQDGELFAAMRHDIARHVQIAAELATENSELKDMRNMLHLCGADAGTDKDSYPNKLRALIDNLILQRHRTGIAESNLTAAEQSALRHKNAAAALNEDCLACQRDLEAARKDVRRYDWLRGNGAIISRAADVPVRYSQFGIGLDAAIDDAIAAQEPKPQA